MLKKIIGGYKTLLISIAQTADLLAVCIGTGFAIVWPLWKFATSEPGIYSICIAFCAAAVLIRFIYYKMHGHSARSVIIFCIRLMLAAAACTACILVILAGHRIFLIPIIAGAFVLSGLCRAFLQEK